MRALLLLPFLVASPLAAAAQGEASAVDRPALQPPRLIEFVEAAWPAEADAAVREASVGLFLTIDASGAVAAVEVAQSGGAAFDEAASAAAGDFRFEPARRDGEAMAARIRYVYEFRLPEPEPEPEPLPAPPPAPAEELVVTVQGESDADRRRNSAEAVVVIDTEQAQRQAADMGAVLARQEGISVRRNGALGSGTVFSLNGLSGDQVRFFIDGVPLELAGFPFGLANVPLAFVDQLEIYRGVVPIRFGADALGGAINLVTNKRPQGTGGSASLLGGAWGTWRLAAEGHHHEERSGFLARAQFFADRADNDYPVDAGVPNARGGTTPVTAERFHDGYQAVGGAVDVGFVDLAWADRISLRLHGATFDKDLQHDLTMANVYGEATWGGLSLGSQVAFEKALSSALRLDALVGYSYLQHELNDTSDAAWFWDGSTSPEVQRKGELGGEWRDQTAMQHAILGRFNLEWTVAPAHTLRFSVAPGFVARHEEDPLQKYAATALAMEAGRQQLNVVAGAEYEIDLFSDALETIVFAKSYSMSTSGTDAVAGEIAHDVHRGGYGAAARLRLVDTVQVRASYELATRLPRADEIFGDGGLIEANLDLRPETSRNINLGVGATDLHTVVGAFRGSVNGFVRSIEDFVVLLPEHRISFYRNAASARARGVELVAGWSDSSGFLHLDGNLTWQDFRNTSTEGSFAAFEGQRMVNRPWFFANASARISLRDLAANHDELSPYWSTRYTNEFFRQWEGPGDREKKATIAAQFVQSTGIHYRVPVGGAVLGATAELDNVTDEKTFDFFGVQRPGRAAYFKGSIEY